MATQTSSLKRTSSTTGEFSIANVLPSIEKHHRTQWDHWMETPQKMINSSKVQGQEPQINGILGMGLNHPTSSRLSGDLVDALCLEVRNMLCSTTWNHVRWGEKPFLLSQPPFDFMRLGNHLYSLLRCIYSWHPGSLATENSKWWFGRGTSYMAN